MTDREKKLNPEITEVFVGIEEIRPVKIYPLSLPDHTEKLPNILIGAYEAFRTALIEAGDLKKMTNEQGLALLEKFRGLLHENIEAILILVCKENERPKLEELTGPQLFTIVDTIFSKNYESVLKNAVDLFKRVKNLKVV